MLVKGCNGDWAIIKAKWEGFRRGIPPIRPGKYTCFNIIKTKQAIKATTGDQNMNFHV